MTHHQPAAASTESRLEKSIANTSQRGSFMGHIVSEMRRRNRTEGNEGNEVLVAFVPFCSNPIAAGIGHGFGRRRRFAILAGSPLR
jgi:hypothetical protein